MANGYKITRSNYTLKRRHQTVSGGVVYERDFMTTTNLGQWDSGVIPYGENNFKFYYHTLANAKKNPYKGEWLKNGDSDFWNAKDVEGHGAPEEEQIKVKPNVNSLLAFAYYGSCVELVKSTVSEIIKNFPAQIYCESGVMYGLDDLVLNNSFEINLKSTVIPDSENVLRYFLKSFSDYEIIKASGERFAILNAELDTTKELNLPCDIYTLNISGQSQNNATTFTIESRRYASGAHFLFGTRGFEEDDVIRPIENNVKEFFDRLDDFGRVLLNTRTNPIYTAVLDSPYETDSGVGTYRKAYTWPTEDGWNLAIDGDEYRRYIDGILSIAEFYDEYYTNNLWRMLTHDSIKAMDLAFSNPQKDEDSEDYNEGTTRLEGLFWAIGRQFDEIKRAIDNIKNTPKVSYDGNNNIPDYFLSDTLELNGWEACNINTTLEKDTKVDTLFDGVKESYTTVDANNVFLRNLKINSGSILAKKGTRQGIESLLGMFGMISRDAWNLMDSASRPQYYDYEISEYIGVVTGSTSALTAVTSIEEELPLEQLNRLKNSKSTDGEYDSLEGLPTLAKIVETQENGIIKYLIPWYDKAKTHDGGFYFQEKGGWGYHNITTDNGNVSGFGETVKYVIIVDTVADLRNIPYSRLYNRVFAYANEVTDEDKEQYSLTSNYFELQNKDYYELINDEDRQGWDNIPQTEIDGFSTERSKKLYYVEHIIENYKANNPHIGYGYYDNGQNYIDTLASPLKYTLDKQDETGEQMFADEAYDCNGNMPYTGENMFAINPNVEDNMKCWYFNPIAPNGNVWKLRKEGNGYIEDSENNIVVNDEDATFTTSAFTFDFLQGNTGNTASEIAADSMINTKVMRIKFFRDTDYEVEFNNFLESAVIPYLIQVIPSGTIFKYEADNYPDLPLLTTLNTTPGVSLNNVDLVMGDAHGNVNDDSIVNYSITE